MTTESLLRYIHFISIFVIVGTLSAEAVLVKATMTRKELGRLAKIDGLYGIAAISLLAAGLTLWLGGFGKPEYFYTKNWIFHSKILLFLMVGILSIKPTIFFLKQRKGDDSELVKVPGSIMTLLKIELALLGLIPLLASLMAKGVGYFGE
jgi:putative membrane protein